MGKCLGGYSVGNGASVLERGRRQLLKNHFQGIRDDQTFAGREL
jgi:hypothetical protein